MRISFKEDTHTYTNEEDVIYTSVSDVVKKLEVAKDWVAKCKAIAKREGINWKDLWNKWQMKKVKGTEAGTMVHEEDEARIISSPTFKYDSKDIKVFPQQSKKSDLKWSIDITKLENNSIYPELMVYSHKHRICGQVDKGIIAKNYIHIYDRKTDEEIKRRGYMTQRGPEMLLFPVNHLEACNYNLYSLKMSMYMWMLWRANLHLKPGKIIIEHANIERDEDGIPVLNEKGRPTILSEKLIELPYRRKEVEDIMKQYGTGNKV